MKPLNPLTASFPCAHGAAGGGKVCQDVQAHLPDGPSAAICLVQAALVCPNEPAVLLEH